jgi:hypothetical protein
MAWLRTNNPATGGGDIEDGGRILCEIAYAINERQHIMGITETEWEVNDLGSYPAVTDLNGKNVRDSNRRLLIAELRLAISAGLIYKTGNYDIYATNSSWTKYGTFAALYADAMGGGSTWETSFVDLEGHDVDDARVFEEMMKCLEKLCYWDVDTKLDGEKYMNIVEHWYRPDGGFDTVQEIYEEAVSNGINHSSGFFRISRSVLWGFWTMDDWPVDLKYEAYASGGGLLRVSLQGSSPYPDIDQLVLTYDVLELGSGARVDLDWYIREISAAQYASPSIEPQGTLEESGTETGVATDETITFNSPDFGQGEALHLRFDSGAGRYFPNDPLASLTTWNWDLTAANVRQSYTDWTYG